MQARDVMTAPVITVAPDTDLREVLALLVEHRIGGVPVVEDGQVIGSVGQGDLVHRHEIGTDLPDDARSWWQRLIGGSPRAVDYVRSHGLHARDVMDDTVVSVDDDAPLSRVATLFESRQVRRVPVLHDGQLVGLISRSDLIRTLAKACTRAPQAGAPDVPVSDETIRRQLLAELSRQSWWLGDWSDVRVAQGVVTFVGLAQRPAEKTAARIAAENIPGVRRVEDQRLLSSELPVM